MVEIVGTICFGLAVLHTFLVKRIRHVASNYRPGSVLENVFHLLGEVEVVFGIWAGVYLVVLAALAGTGGALDYLEGLNFTEPAFVFVIMVVCASKPVMIFVEKAIRFIARRLPMNHNMSFYMTTLVLGPVLGSVITEPAAMTVTALLLFTHFYSQKISSKLMYATLGILFVNVSIGGTLTPYAAPPVLMVAGTWNWDVLFMLTHFGWKALVAIVASTAIMAYLFRKELAAIPIDRSTIKSAMPVWVIVTHLAVLAAIVANAHHMTIFVMLFLLFLGITTVTGEYQSELKIREGLLVAFFLGGLVILGGPQKWWLESVLSQMDSLSLYLASIGLTAIVDNAALTYLGSLTPGLSDASKYALVAGSVVGGGLTVIANAPNPAGFGILNPAFGEEGISPYRLFVAALFPTVMAAACFWLL